MSVLQGGIVESSSNITQFKMEESARRISQWLNSNFGGIQMPTT